MSESVREHLLGYLLDALEPEEAEQVDRALENNAQLRGELDALAAHLHHLEADRDHHEPPPGLASETCRRLAIQWDDEAGADTITDAFDPPQSHSSQSISKLASHSALTASSDAASSNTASSDTSPTPRLHPVSAREGSAFRHWSFADFFVAGGIVVAAAFLFLPALAHSRFDAQRLACQNSLRQLGVALVNYSEVHGGQFPRIPTEGKRAFAGIFAPALREGGYLPESAALSCPSSDIVRRSPFSRIPSLAEIDAARDTELVELQANAGGGFGYNAGWMQGDEYRGAVNHQRPFYALVADAPSQRVAGQQSDNHGSRGQNVLYEDGHFSFLRRCAGRECSDELYLNRAGRIAPGVDENDAVIIRGEVRLPDLLRSR